MANAALWQQRMQHHSHALRVHDECKHQFAPMSPVSLGDTAPQAARAARVCSAVSILMQSHRTKHPSKCNIDIKCILHSCIISE